MHAQTHRLTGLEALATLVDLGAASIAAGVIARRRPVVRLLERMQADGRAATRMKRLRKQFGRGPVELVLPGRRIVVILDPEDVGRVLAGAPDPFHPANIEKRKALEQFQPHGVLISKGPIREQRRVVNEFALDYGNDLHRLAPTFAEVIADEARHIIDDAAQRGQLDSMRFMAGWWRLVRRLTLGRSARDDEAVTDVLLRLRKSANWSFLSLPHHRARAEFFQRLYGYTETPEPGTLAAAVTEIPVAGAVDPIGQMPHWLFAFDAAGMALLRALALVASHPAERTRALADADQPDVASPRPFLRSAVLESVRLWPTTPTILRDTTEDTEWRDGPERFTIDAGAALMIVVPAFHRDDDLLPFAHRFTPDIWLDGRAERYPQLVPFSAGPGECPGRNLVLFVTSTLLAHLLSALDVELASTPRLNPDQPLPLTFNQLTLKFAVTPLKSTASTS
jgi:Cytochrome P450